MEGERGGIIDAGERHEMQQGLAGTALNAVVRPDLITVVTDTLAVDLHARTPTKFSSKVLLLPHLQGVVCGTGSFNLLMDWFRIVEQQIVARDLPHAGRYAPPLLRQLASALVSTHKTPDAGMGVVYHFGVCSRTNSCRAFGFDSERAFEPREYTDCLILRPAFDSLPPPPTGDEDARHWFIRMVDAQRALAVGNETTRTYGIGGELHLTTIGKHGLSVQTIHRFDDYESDYAAMLAGMAPA